MTVARAPRTFFAPPDRGNVNQAQNWPAAWTGGVRGRGVGGAGGLYNGTGWPFNWFLYDNGTNQTWDLDEGVQGGEKFIEWFVKGGNGATFNDFGPINETVPVAVGQVWEGGMYLAYSPGTTTFPTSIAIDMYEWDAALSYVTNQLSSTIIATPSTGVPFGPRNPVRVAAQFTVAGGTTTSLSFNLNCNWAASAQNCKLRLFRPFQRRVS